MKKNYTDYLIIFVLVAVLVNTWEIVYYGNLQEIKEKAIIQKLDSINNAITPIPDLQRNILVNQQINNDRMGRIEDMLDLVKRRQEK